MVTAVTSVREARAGDVPAVAAVHARAWRAAYAGLLDAGTLAALTPEALEEAWRAAITAPPSPRHAVLVALTDDLVVGFAAVAPSEDADAADGDGELVALAVDPLHQRGGHGSRLLSAATDRLRDDGFTAVTAWTPAPDGPRRAFLASAGLLADGASRTYAGQDLVELRYAADLPEGGA